MNRIASAACCALVAAGLIVPSASAQPPVVEDGLRAFSIIPPGQSGAPLSPHASDQLEMYASLIDDDNITEDELGDYFHSAQFGPDVIESQYSPRSDVTVYLDSFGIPHVYATTDEGAFFGLGYETARDRLWHMDVLRHAAKGEVSEILGAGAVAFDKEIRRDFYTEAERQNIFDRLDERYGAQGATIQMSLNEYAAGVNALIAEIRDGIITRPPEYLVQGVEIEDWSPLDTVALTAFQVRSFGTSGGGELHHAALLEELRDHLGRVQGNKAFKDLLWRNDGGSYTTIPPQEGNFPSQNFGAPDPKAIAIPDDVDSVYRKVARGQRVVQRMLHGLGMRSPSSNWLAVAPDRAVNGGALQFGAPQVGYSAPQFFMDIDVHSPGYDFRGPALPGASTAIPLGRVADFAWSLTTGNSDLVDARVERLCALGDARPTRNSSRYMYKGRCRSMQARTETIEVKNGSPVSYKIYRTVHGPVVARGSAEGKPAAFVFERSYWKKEHDFIVALWDILDGGVSSAQDFGQAISKASVSFNAIYSGPDGIAYFHSGRYPDRAQGVHPLLPSWGTGRWEWEGRKPFSENPQLIYPDQGWLANWNNQPASEWANGDTSFWGPTHRVGILADQMTALFANGGQAVLSDIVDVIREAATVDGRAYFIGQDMIGSVAGATGLEAAALTAVGDWIAAGSDRVDQDRDGNQDHGPGVAVFDTWYEEFAHGVFDDDLGPALDVFDFPISDKANPGGSAYYGDFSNYLWNLFNNPDFMRLDYCDDRDTEPVETCADIATAALSAAVAELSASKGADLATWTWPADEIVFDELGAVSIPNIPWQNRGTYNHAIEVLSP